MLHSLWHAGIECKSKFASGQGSCIAGLAEMAELDFFGGDDKRGSSEQPADIKASAPAPKSESQIEAAGGTAKADDPPQQATFEAGLDAFDLEQAQEAMRERHR